MERIKIAIERARQQQAVSPPARRDRPGDAGTDGACSPAAPASPEHANLGAPVDLLPLDPVHLEKHRIVTLDPVNPFRREFDLLRTQVLQKMQEKGWRTIAVTSPSVQSGKTVVAVNLALSIAHHPSRTALLVDFDLRRPQVAAYLGLPPADSMNEVLEGRADLRDAIVHAGIPRFLVLPTRRRVPHAAEMLSSDQVAKIIGRLRDHYPERVIIFDMPPITAVDDVIAVLPKMDCVLLVVGSGSSSRRELEETQRHLGRSNLLGVVVNKVAEQPALEDYY
ncbi:MAG TPA: CpsD/CapB family tyrosine-protein kinase [Ramlibacter sp.]|nr:CpsD/CapB family tyrosine-protein kinase [Ramlibacter sp.]